jgi:RNA-directed DNA polymerase
MSEVSPFRLGIVGFEEIDPKLFEISDLTSVLEYQENSGFPTILDIAMLADILGVRKQTLSWLRKEKNTQYSLFSIPKKGKANKGKYRRLQNPKPRMKYLQKQIKKKILDPAEKLLPEYVTGFRKGKGTRHTADVHTNKLIVVSLDLRHYFNSIKQKHLLELFELHYKYPYNVARFLSELCTFKFFVPEGAPTSPSIANIAGHYFFDEELYKIAKDNEFNYTRYADDITLSTDREFPKIEHSDDKGNVFVKSEIDNVITSMAKVISSKGFKLNVYKTKIMRKPARQYMLGMVVNNEEPTLLRRKRELLKCILHNMSENNISEEAQKTGRTEVQFLDWVRGQINYFIQVNEIKGKKLKDKFDLILKSKGYNKLITEIAIL